MPVNPQHLLEAVRKFGLGLAASEASAQAARADALELLQRAAAAPDALKATLEDAAAKDSGLRCAAPAGESLLANIECGSAAAPPALLAVDGSQVFPDRHAEILFGLVNTGAVLFVPGSGAAPTVTADTQLLSGDALRSRDGRLITEGDLALRRDSAERASLLRHALDPGSIALTDGPLELWGPKQPSDTQAFERALTQYLEQLRELQRRGITLAGYVDKPGADLVIRMLELTPTATQNPTAGDSRMLRLPGASDRHLFASLLGPGCRSAVFELISSSRPRYIGDVALHFFYLNTGDASHPMIARVEIPKWVAMDSIRMASLHGTLLDQCRLLGARPYPYILHRAHEAAIVSTQEKEQIKLRLLMEMRSQGLEPDSVSSKSSAKAVSQGGGSD